MDRYIDGQTRLMSNAGTTFLILEIMRKVVPAYLPNRPT
jgi:hypothetical protein